jgi:hypothetical protein
MMELPDLTKGKYRATGFRWNRKLSNCPGPSMVLESRRGDSVKKIVLGFPRPISRMPPPTSKNEAIERLSLSRILFSLA